MRITRKHKKDMGTKEKARKKEKVSLGKYLYLAGVMFVELDTRGIVTLINRKGCEILGYEEDQILDKNWFDNFIPSSQREKVKDVFNKLIAETITPFEYYENPVLTSSGEERIIAWHNTFLRNDQGEIIGTLSSGEDITERKLTEAALLESEKRYRTLFEGAAEGILVTEVKTKKFLYANPAICRLLGYSEAELLTMKFEDIHPESELDHVHEQFTKQLKGELIKVDNIPCLRKDGSVIYTEINSNVATLDGKDCMVGFFTDITDRRKAEIELKESRIRLETAGRASYDLIYEWDVSTSSLTWFGDIDTLLGYKKGEISRDIKAWLALIHPDDSDKMVEAVGFHENSTDPIKYEYRVKHKDGNYRFWKDHGLPLLDETGKPYRWIGVCTDVTETKKAEAEIVKLAKFPSQNPNPVLQVDREGNLLYANDASYEMLKEWDLSLGTQIPDILLSEIDPSSSQKVRSFDLKCGNSYFSFTMAYIPETGHVNIYGRDVTDLKISNEALIESEKQKNLILNTTKEMIAYYDTNLTILWANRASAESLGTTPEAMVGSQCHELWHGSEDPCPDCPLTKVLETNKPQQGEKETPDGKKWFLRGYPIMDEDGEIVALVEFGLDITAKKQAEDALKEEKQFTDKALDTQADTFFLFEPATGKAIRWNKAFRDISGYSDEEIAQLPAPATYYSPQDLKRAAVFIDQVMKTGTGTIELDLVSKDGSTTPTEYRVSLIRDQEGKPIYFISIGRDISERKKTEQELKKYRTNLEKLVKERTEELEEKNKELERFNRLFVGREFRIKELRNKVKELEKKLNGKEES